ncbi:Sel1 repeat-containing protein [Paraburkholderia sp. BL6669N2]|uniref:tetratricopeptide repeat protein n=1 Tax=Paraburkholderia sp. BL6669N2 TaxID=1938807 RepID=UPI000E27DAB0|nr:tetratricopeptide repeat protein [Paraburkholderia sp. BL6669N2]REG59648.1 Sel1 repeat-containing protein [Paraburkholderia sp. BL6669N2]
MDMYDDVLIPMLEDGYGGPGQAPLEVLYELAVSLSESHTICPCKLAHVGDFLLSQERAVESVLGQLLIQDAAQMGYGRARVAAAKLLSTGKHIRRDYEKAHQLLMAVLHDMGSTCDDITEASRLLADNYLCGRGAVRDVKRALSLYESAYRLGLPEAAYRLASALEDPRNKSIFPLNRLEMAAKYYELVKDDVQSCKSALAFLHLRGGWVEADPKYGRHLLDLAAAEGDYFAHLFFEVEKTGIPMRFGLDES